MLFQAFFLILGPLATDASGLNDACGLTNSCAMVTLQMNQEKLFKATKNAVESSNVDDSSLSVFEDFPKDHTAVQKETKETIYISLAFVEEKKVPQYMTNEVLAKAVKDSVEVLLTQDPVAGDTVTSEVTNATTTTTTTTTTSNDGDGSEGDDGDDDGEVSTTPTSSEVTTTPTSIYNGVVNSLSVSRKKEPDRRGWPKTSRVEVTCKSDGCSDSLVSFVDGLQNGTGTYALGEEISAKLKSECEIIPGCDKDSITIYGSPNYLRDPPPGLKGDPHAIYHGHKVTFSLPKHYVKLFEQDQFAVYGLGGTPSTKFSSQNFMYSALVRLGGKEFIRVTQKKDAELFASHDDTEVKLSQFKISLGGSAEDWAQSIETGHAKRATLQKNGFEDVHVHAEREKVTVSLGALKIAIRSTASQWDKNIPNHIDFVVQEGLDKSKATGVLPELWGLQPMSEQTKHMIKEDGGSSFLLSLASETPFSRDIETPA